MAYQIFTLRKLMLTQKINTIGLKMMNIQFEKQNIQDELLGLYDEMSGYSGDTETTGRDINDVRSQYGVSSGQSDSSEDNKNAALKHKINEAQIKENRLDMIIKRLESQLTAAQNELQSVESQEGNAIKMSTPKYGGVGQQ